MWINYRFRHAVQWENRIPVMGSSITVADLERAIIAAKLSFLTEKKSRRRLAELRFLFYNAETGEEYSGDNEHIPANTQVIVHLITLWSKAFLESKRASQEKTQLRSSMTEVESKQDIVRVKKSFGSVWRYLKTPPGYICHRCQSPGHYIQACPTNGDTSYDFKARKHLTDIFKSASEKNLANSRTIISSSRRLPTELNCTLCKEVMKEAVLTSCCFNSFCDKCIRDRIISRVGCACGAPDVPVDDLVPNKTLRETIKRLVLSTSNSSTSDKSCCLQAQEHHRHCGSVAPPPPITLSATTKGSAESVAVSGVTTDSLLEEAAKQLDAPTLVSITAKSSALPSSVGTPNVEVQQKSGDMGSRKRVSSDKDAFMIKLIDICIAFVCLLKFIMSMLYSCILCQEDAPYVSYMLMCFSFCRLPLRFVGGGD